MVLSRAGTPQQERSRVTRGRLLDAAAECLAELGYSGTTTIAVCERAGVSRGAQLHHFPSKEALLTGAVQHLGATRDAAVRARAKTASAESTLQLVRDLIWFEFAGPLFYAASELWQASRTDLSLRAIVYPIEREFGRMIHQLYADVFPAEISQAPWFHDALDTTLYVMRGLALTRILKADPLEEERVVELCAALFERGSADVRPNSARRSRRNRGGRRAR
jgi:AcrR family transcriptional regulator